MAMLLLCLLSLIGSKVDSMSIADQLFSMTEETTDSQPNYPPPPPPPPRLIVAGDDDVDDDDVDDDDVASVAKRSPWTQYEVNVDNLRQNIIRSKMFSNRQKHSSPPHLDAPGSTEKEEEKEEEAYFDGFVAGWSQAKAYLEEETGPTRSSPSDDAHLDIPVVSRRFAKQRGGPRVAPVHLGMGTARASLDNFVALLAEGERRKSTDDHPVRFVGKRRYATDE